MSSTNSTYHIPFPKTFLTVNARPKQAAPRAPILAQPEFVAHGFLSNRPTARHQSISSVSSITSVAQSEAGTISPPSSPPTKAADSSVAGKTLFAPLPVNTKSLSPPSFQEMSAAERQRRMSFEKHSFLSNVY